jgi:transcriptional regulator with XRE-family HTH domain
MPGFKTRGFADIGPALRFLRLHGPSAPSKQKEVAARAAVTKGMLSSYERSKQEPSLSTLARLLTALDADLYQLDWALRMVASSPGADPGSGQAVAAIEAGSGELLAGTSRWGDSEVAESSPPYGAHPSSYRLVKVPEPLSDEEERALGQMLAGFLAYLRHTREGRPGSLGDGGGGEG